MIRIDQETQWIYMTRSDTENIIFGAKDKTTKEPYVPTAKDRLIFSAAKKIGDKPLLEIVNVMDNDANSIRKTLRIWHSANTLTMSNFR